MPDSHEDEEDSGNGGGGGGNNPKFEWHHLIPYSLLHGVTYKNSVVQQLLQIATQNTYDINNAQNMMLLQKYTIASGGMGVHTKHTNYTRYVANEIINFIGRYANGINSIPISAILGFLNNLQVQMRNEIKDLLRVGNPRFPLGLNDTPGQNLNTAY